MTDDETCRAKVLLLSKTHSIATGVELTHYNSLGKRYRVTPFYELSYNLSLFVRPLRRTSFVYLNPGLALTSFQLAWIRLASSPRG